MNKNPENTNIIFIFLFVSRSINAEYINSKYKVVPAHIAKNIELSELLIQLHFLQNVVHKLNPPATPVFVAMALIW